MTMANEMTNMKRAKSINSNMYARVQPQAVEMEQAVLGALMIDVNAFDLISNILTPESFYDPRNQQVFGVILKLFNSKEGRKPIDVLTVTDQLAKQGKLEEVGGPGYVAELSSGVATSANIEYHARVLAQKALARKLIKFANMVENRAFDETTDIDDLMQDAEENLFRLSKENIKNDYKQIDPILKDAIHEVSAAAGNSDGITGIATGYEELDRLTSGWQNSDLIIIAG